MSLTATSAMSQGEEVRFAIDSLVERAGGYGIGWALPSIFSILPAKKGRTG
jgi:hypothetical protein